MRTGTGEARPGRGLEIEDPEYISVFVDFPVRSGKLEVNELIPP